MSKPPKMTFVEWCENEEGDWVELMDKIDDLHNKLDAVLDQPNPPKELVDYIFECDLALAALAVRCAKLCDDARFVMITEMYKQNPLIKMLYEGKLPPGTTPFTAPVRR